MNLLRYIIISDHQLPSIYYKRSKINIGNTHTQHTKTIYPPTTIIDCLFLYNNTTNVEVLFFYSWQQFKIGITLTKYTHHSAFRAHYYSWSADCGVVWYECMVVVYSVSVEIEINCCLVSFFSLFVPS